MFSFINSDFSEEIYLYLKSGGKIKNLPPEDNPVRVSVNTKIKEREDEEIYFNKLNPIFHILFCSE